MARDISRHPCFNDEMRHTCGRVHLPVAPRCNIQCNFCNRRYDCVNESRPGVTSVILTPRQALWYTNQAVEKDPRLSVVGIAGPGDPFANAEETVETMRLVREEFPEMLLCVASNGLNVSPYVDDLAEIGVTHMTITVNAVDPEIGQHVYAWVRDGKRVLRGLEAAKRLWEKQRDAIIRLVEKDVLVKINTIIIPGVNDHHVEEVAKTVGELGATILNALPIYPVEGTPFEAIPEVERPMLESIREAAGRYMPLMHHCTRCRADAVGVLGEAASQDLAATLQTAATLPLHPGEDRPYVAVASREGMLVNQHLGEARALAIYERTSEGYDRIGVRPTPEAGGGDERWRTLARTLGDCSVVLVSHAGPTPTRMLAAEGIRVCVMEGLVEEGLDAVFNGKPLRSPCRTATCSAGCSGSGGGCG